MRATLWALLLISAAGGEPTLEQACNAGGTGCPLMEDSASVSLMQSHTSGIKARGGASTASLQRQQVEKKQQTEGQLDKQQEQQAVAGQQQKQLLDSRQEGKTEDHARQGEQQKQQKQQQGELKQQHLHSQVTGKQDIVLQKQTLVGASNSNSPKGPKTGTCIFWGIMSAALLGAGYRAGAGQDEQLVAKSVAEFVGTAMLVFSVGCNVLVGNPTWNVVSIASTLMVAIYALGGVSGANFNPAVTFALWLCGKTSTRMCLSYVCTQLAAGIAAGIAYSVMLGQTFELGPGDSFTYFEAGLAEVLYTAMLCFAVLNTAVSKAHAGNDQFYGLAIGFSIVAGGYGAGSISGGCFNPAVAIGVNSIADFGLFDACDRACIYVLFELAGAGVAAMLFRYCRPGDFNGDEQSFAAKLLSEFVGTFMLILTVGLNVLAESPAAVFSIAASLMVMIFSLGSVSGAHFNPAVTFAIFLSGRKKIEAHQAIAYVITQVSAGITAALVYMVMMKGHTVSLKPSGSSGEALFGELVFTFLLSFVVLCVATVQSPLSQYFGLAIGSCVTAGGLAIGSLSGGSLNPAVSSGLAISDCFNGGSMAWLPSYAAVELLGGAAAALTFKATHPAEYEEK